MTHLTPEEFIETIDAIDAIDATKPIARIAHAHLDACASCREQVEVLRRVMADATMATPVAAPSPLFWEHFSARVHAVVEREPMPVSAWWRGWWRPALALATVAACGLMVVLGGTINERRVSGPAAVTSVASTEAESGATDESWNFVLQIASAAPAEELQRMASPTVDSTAAMVESLTPQERIALVRLLKAQMGGAE
jgi:hypothetical protein